MMPVHKLVFKVLMIRNYIMSTKAIKQLTSMLKCGPKMPLMSGKNLKVQHKKKYCKYIRR
jgi:hypothetical protein